MIILLQDGDLRQRLGSAARDRALSFFTIQRATDAYQSLYMGLADRALPEVAASAGAAVGEDTLVAAGTTARQLMYLQRAYALLRLGVPIAALDQFHRALDVAPGGPAGPAILSQVAEIESELGAGAAAIQHYASAWILSQVQSA
jgi:hypothetical protein